MHLCQKGPCGLDTYLHAMHGQSVSFTCSASHAAVLFTSVCRARYPKVRLILILTWETVLAVTAQPLNQRRRRLVPPLCKAAVMVGQLSKQRKLLPRNPTGQLRVSA